MTALPGKVSLYKLIAHYIYILVQLQPAEADHGAIKQAHHTNDLQLQVKRQLPTRPQASQCRAAGVGKECKELSQTEQNVMSQIHL